MKISRHFTAQDLSPYDGVEFRKTSSEIKNPDGSIVFALDDIEKLPDKMATLFEIDFDGTNQHFHLNSHEYTSYPDEQEVLL